MSELPKNLHPAAARSLTLWHAMVAKKDLAELRTIVHPDAVFRSPTAIAPFRPAAALLLALNTVIQVFQDFTYHRQLASDDGLDVVLEFSATVGDRKLKGIDFIRFDEFGQIVDFEVMVRPLSGLQALAEEMARRLGSQMTGFKGEADKRG